MARSNDPAAVIHIARFLLTGKVIAGADFEPGGPPALIFTSPYGGEDKTYVTISTKTWFKSHYVVDTICLDEHPVHGRMWGHHSASSCPQFRQRVEDYRDRKFVDVQLEGTTLILMLDGELRLFIEDDSDYVNEDFAGWGVIGRLPTFVTGNGVSGTAAVIPDEIEAIRHQNWDWKSDHV